MPKPCGHPENEIHHFAGQGISCRVCWLYANDPVYRQLWGDSAGEQATASPGATAEGTPAGPGFVRRVANFAGAALAHVVSGLQTVPQEEQSRRMAICQGCELFHAASGTCRHSSCGCYVARKTAWAEQHCPVGRW